MVVGGVGVGSAMGSCSPWLHFQSCKRKGCRDYSAALSANTLLGVDSLLQRIELVFVVITLKKHLRPSNLPDLLKVHGLYTVNLVNALIWVPTCGNCLCHGLVLRSR